MRGESGAGGPVRRIAARTTVASGVIGAIGIGFLVAMFVSFAVATNGPALVLGRVNDVCVLVSYLLCAPSVIAVWARLRRGAPAINALLALLGLGAIVAIVVLQALLVIDAVTFEEQVVPVSIALLTLGVWFVLAGHLGSSSGALPGGTRMGLLAATYIGYPIWAFWLGRRLRPAAGPATETSRPDPVAATADR